MIKIRVLKESINEIILDEAKEDKLYDNHWGNDRHLEMKFRRLLVWIYGRHSGPGQWQGVSSEMMKKFKEKGKEFAPKRQQRIKYLDWGSDMLKLGYMGSDVIDSLKLFEKFSQQFQEKEIKSYESPDAILNTYKKEVVMRRVGKARKERGKSEPRATEEDRTVIYQDDNLFVIRPHNVDASCHYGRKTKWCIAQPGNDYFREYTQEEGKIFYFIKDDRRKPDDRYAKIAIQISGDEGDIEFDGFWDRYDNEDFGPSPRSIGELPSFFGEDEITKAIRAIQDHAEKNPPVKGEMFHLEELENAVFEGVFSTDAISFFAETGNQEWGNEMPYITISANVLITIELDQLQDYDPGAVREAWEAAEEDLKERLTDWATSDVEGKVDSGWGQPFELDIHETDPTTAWVRVDLSHEEFVDADRARGHLEYMMNYYGETGHDNYSEQLAEIMMEELSQYLESEGRERIANVAKDLWKIESKLKHFEAQYDEDDHEIYFMQKTSYELPLRIKSFNAPFKGYEATSRKREKIGRYIGFIKRYARDEWENALRKAMAQVDFKAREMSLRQEPLPGFERQKDISPSQTFPAKFQLMVGMPGIEDISGGTKSDKPSIKSNINIWVDKTQQEAVVNYTIRYIQWIDRHLPDVYEAALKNIDLDRIQRHIDDKYAEIFVDSAEMQSLKHQQGFGQETYTESKRRIKIRIK